MDTSAPDSQALPQGAHLQEFVIERVLGSGGFGITYLARDTSLGRQVVIKENLPSQFAWRETTTGTVRPRHTSGGDVDDYEWSMKNFLREAETLASLDHPGIVRVLRKFEANGTAYFVMPFVEGVAFDELIHDHAVGVARKRLRLVVVYAACRRILTGATAFLFHRRFHRTQSLSR